MPLSNSAWAFGNVNAKSPYQHELCKSPAAAGRPGRVCPPWGPVLTLIAVSPCLRQAPAVPYTWGQQSDVTQRSRAAATQVPTSPARIPLRLRHRELRPSTSVPTASPPGTAGHSPWISKPRLGTKQCLMCHSYVSVGCGAPGIPHTAAAASPAHAWPEALARVQCCAGELAASSPSFWGFPHFCSFLCSAPRRL